MSQTQFEPTKLWAVCRRTAVLLSTYRVDVSVCVFCAVSDLVLGWLICCCLTWSRCCSTLPPGTGGLLAFFSQIDTWWWPPHFWHLYWESRCFIIWPDLRPKKHFPPFLMLLRTITTAWHRWRTFPREQCWWWIVQFPSIAPSSIFKIPYVCH
jgi:hypothetical protein